MRAAASSAGPSWIGVSTAASNSFQKTERAPAGAADAPGALGGRRSAGVSPVERATTRSAVNVTPAAA